VNEDHSRGTLSNRESEHLARMDQRGVQNATGHENRPHEPVPRVEKKSVELLLRPISQGRPHDAKDVGGSSDGGTGRVHINRSPTPQFEGSRQPARRCAPHPGDGLERSDIRRGEARGRPETRQESGGDRRA